MTAALSTHAEGNAMSPEVRCNGCTFYYVTHDAAFPYGCRALAFKSRQLPSREVLIASGQACQLFAARSRTGLATP